MTDHQDGLAEVIAAMRKAAEESRSAGPRTHDAAAYIAWAQGVDHAADMLAAYHARLTTGRGTE